MDKAAPSVRSNLRPNEPTPVTGLAAPLQRPQGQAHSMPYRGHFYRVKIGDIFIEVRQLRNILLDLRCLIYYHTRQVGVWVLFDCGGLSAAFSFLGRQIPDKFFGFIHFHPLSYLPVGRITVR